MFYFFKWQICMLMRRHFEASLKRKKSEDSSQYAQYPVQSPEQASEVRTWLLCYKNRSKPEVHTKKPCIAFQGRHPLWCFFLVSRCSEARCSLFFLFSVKEFKERLLIQYTSVENKANEVKFEYVSFGPVILKISFLW